jgi:hypothetical protein
MRPLQRRIFSIGVTNHLVYIVSYLFGRLTITYDDQSRSSYWGHDT